MKQPATYELRTNGTVIDLEDCIQQGFTDNRLRRNAPFERVGPNEFQMSHGLLGVVRMTIEPRPYGAVATSRVIYGKFRQTKLLLVIPLGKRDDMAGGLTEDVFNRASRFLNERGRTGEMRRLT